MDRSPPLLALRGARERGPLIWPLASGFDPRWKAARLYRPRCGRIRQVFGQKFSRGVEIVPQNKLHYSRRTLAVNGVLPERPL